MAIDPQRLLDRAFPAVVQAWTERDTMLYALSVGLGADWPPGPQLRFVYERDLLALPSMAFVLGWPGLWFTDPATGIDAAQVVNGGQHVRLHGPAPTQATVRSTTSIVGVQDKGAGRGALVHLEREVRNDSDGALIALVSSSLFCRGDGGCGSAGLQLPSPAPLPERSPDATAHLATLAQAALLYRLNGDRHPLHADPDVARNAGFERPPLHGLCTLGIAGHGLLKTLCDYEPQRLRSLGGRLSAPVYPGDTVSLDIWRETGSEARFCAWVRARGSKVVDNGVATLVEA